MNFATRTTFAIDPNRIHVLSSAYEGCIEVHLLNWDRNTDSTPCGGNGLCLSGELPKGLRERFDTMDRLALIAGFDEVFTVATAYADVIVLRPAEKGLDWRWNALRLARWAGANRVAGWLRRKLQQRATALTGGIQRDFPGTGPFRLVETEGTAQSPVRSAPLNAVTVHEARLAARARVEELRAQGWNCGQEQCFRGRIEPEKPQTVKWLCLKDDRVKHVGVGLVR